MSEKDQLKTGVVLGHYISGKRPELDLLVIGTVHEEPFQKFMADILLVNSNCPVRKGIVKYYRGEDTNAMLGLSAQAAPCLGCQLAINCPAPK